MMDRVSKALHTKSFSFIRKVDYKSLMAVIQNEHPQTLAFILSYANAEQASKIIAELPGDIRIDVVERIAGIPLSRWLRKWSGVKSGYPLQRTPWRSAG